MKTRKKRRWIIWTSLALVVVIVFVVVVVNKAKKTLEAMMPAYQQEQASIGDLSLTVYGSGSLAPTDSINVPAPMSGTVAEWYFDMGDEVKEGDILGVMDTDRYDEEVDALKDKIDELETAIENYQVEQDASIAYSPIEGVVKEVYVQPGSDVSRVNQVYGCYMVIAPDETMTVSFTPSGGYARDVGDYVRIVSDGYDAVNGKVVSVAGATSTAEVAAYIPSGTSVTIEDISGKEEIGSGTLVAKNAVTITGQNEIAAVNVQSGQRVAKGQQLLKYDSAVTGSIEDKKDDLADAKEELSELEDASPEIVATADGVLTAVNDTELVKDLTAAQISPLDAMDLIVAIDELDIGKIQVGQSADISIDALPDESYTGSVSRISQVGQAMGGVTTYDVTLTIQETGGLRIGMNASAEILVDKREGVVILPLEAIKYQGDRPYVLLADDSARAGDNEAQGANADVTGGKNFADMTDEERQAMVQNMTDSLANGGGTVQYIEVGLMNEQYAEIINGIEAGDTVLVPVSSSLMDFSNMVMGGGQVVVTESHSESGSRGGRWE
jgi:HlyD family secretion protein